MTKSRKQYEDIYSSLDENKRVLAQKMYTEADFMEQTLAKLRKIIKSEGAVLSLKNGNGVESISEHPAQKSYNTMIKNYNATLKQLADLAPEKKKDSKLDRDREDD